MRAFTAGGASVVCHVCAKTRGDILEDFGTEGVVKGGRFGNWVGLGTICPQIPAQNRVPDYGLHGVVRVLRAGLVGIEKGLVEVRGYSAVQARRNVQAVCDTARVESGCRSLGDLQGEDGGQEVRIECGAGVWFMRKEKWRGWVERLGEGGDGAVQLWARGVVDWFEAFQVTCIYAWKTDFLGRGDLDKLGNALVCMGRVHRGLGWKVTMWVHHWIDHMLWYAKKWLILGVFSCFRMEGSHRRLKSLLRRSGGTAWMGGKMGLQGVVDGHTLDDALAGEGYDTTRRGVGRGNVPGGRAVSRKRRWSQVGR